MNKVITNESFFIIKIENDYIRIKQFEANGKLINTHLLDIKNLNCLLVYGDFRLAEFIRPYWKTEINELNEIPSWTYKTLSDKK